jgi:chemotaxis protein MotB
MAKLKAVPNPAPVVEEDDEPDCPRCPPVGAPAWMATFADMATLLMAFFVLILSFANFDEVSFKKMTGALREHFGVRMVEIMPNPESTTILEMDFRPTKTPPAPQEAPTPESNPDTSPLPDTQSQSQSEHQSPSPDAIQALAKALSEALEAAGASATVQDGTLTLQMQDPSGALEQALQDAAPDLAMAEQTPDAGQASSPDAGQASSPDTGQASSPDTGQASSPDTGQGPSPDAENAPGNAGQNAKRRAAIAEARMNVALRELQGTGLVDVQREQEKVIVTVGAGGAFASGSADLTDDAREIMARIALASAGDRGKITVTGHTDGVPLAGGPFTDNWGLAAARAASVVRELGSSGMVAPDRLSAISRGESAPLAPNDTEEGRAKNRRIEIEIDFAAIR